jgi:hypothetical protein
MLIATSVCSILLVAAHARWAAKSRSRQGRTGRLCRERAAVRGEWLVRASAPSSTAVFVYLHVSGAGPLLASGFWLIASERFDPRTAKRRFGQISGAGTLGGLLGALLAARAAAWGVPAMLLVLAAFQFLSAWLVRRLAVQLEPVAAPRRPTRKSCRPPRDRGCASSPTRHTCAISRRSSCSERPALRSSNTCSKPGRTRRLAPAIISCVFSRSIMPQPVSSRSSSRRS